MRRGAADRTCQAAIAALVKPRSSGCHRTDKARLSGGGVEADPRLVGQDGDPLRPKQRRERAEHAWQALPQTITGRALSERRRFIRYGMG
jgi:hypothetical protein